MRVGKTYYQPGRKDRRGARVFGLILLVLFLVVAPIILYSMDSSFHLLVASIGEIEGDVVEVESPSQVPHFGRKIIYTTGEVDSNTVTRDPDFNFEVPALRLSRHTEYCQWMEHTREKCQTCSETVRNSDGSTSTRSYDCNCVTTYYYTKQWTSFRINSLFFNQPGAHFNPQRDPFPGSTFVSQNSGVNGFKIDPPMLHNLKANSERLEWTDSGYRDPGFFDFIGRPIQEFFGIQDHQYRHTSEIESVRHSLAARDHAFFYVGRGGYFFSPYEASVKEQVFKWLIEGLEGSLFDWQLGDFVGCVAGDIRVSYSASMPPEISTIGQSTERNGVPLITTISTQEGKKMLGLVHDGDASPEEMFEREVNDSKFWLKGYQIFFILWAGCMAHAAGIYFALLPQNLTLLCNTITIWGSVVFLLRWLSLWRYSLDSGMAPFIAMGFVCSFVASTMYFPKSSQPGGIPAIQQWFSSVLASDVHETTVPPKK
eukprot:CAMPEP_0201481044 /NCGR_PEP_ID=MMETSP0151_2-20130828/5379_1 /ASSEMBLY_ACC=CAM_ASM_000257 /TAXON_ID=200890 /ORGANISM="Paramoeba atlantica, Strain 621/1 / CCAP 1560/9" /LENGTH=483 /DNA_ID=CAMNT_0047863067 /DNA_START=80 /DNA_END=1528 /DNA_ORIENTATION=+